MIITLPEDYEIKKENEGQWYKFYWGQKYIEQKKQTKDEFTREVNKLRDQLKSIKHDGEEDSLDYDKTLKNGDRILFSWSYAFGSDLYKGTAYAWRNGITYIFTSNILGKENIDHGKEGLIKFLTNLRYRSPDEIPNTPGFCFENGFIADDGKEDHYEEASIVFSLKSHPDLRFGMEISQRRLEKADSLITRGDRANISPELRAVFNSNVKILSKDKYNTDYLNGERLCVNSPLSEFEKPGRMQLFRWENQGVYHNVLKPYISVDFSSGDRGYEASSLSDDAAMDLFSQFINKIRPRPIKGVQQERW